MLLKIFAAMFFLSLGMIFFGIDQIFTVKWGEKWYPGLSSSFWKIPDEISFKLIFYGIVLLLFTVILGAILKI